MLAQLVNDRFVDECRALAATELERTIGARGRRGGAPGALDPFATEQLRAVVEQLRVPRTESASATVPGVAPKDDLMYMPRDPLASIVQSVIEEYVEDEAPQEILRTPLPDGRRSGASPLITDARLRDVPLRAQTGDRRLWRPFEVARPKILSDPGWLVSGVVIAWNHFQERATFRPPGAVVPLADRARVILVGDWGSGLKRAQDVAEQIRAALAAGAAEQRELHVVHLGDVYYTGGAKEYERRFLRHWPVDAGSSTASFSLMGNHDMYRGGHAYFDTCLTDARFARQQGSSVFALRGAHWQFLGLDSSFDDKDLHGDQAAWVLAQLPAGDATAPGRLRTALLSHHQLHSAYEPGAKPMAEKIEPALATGKIDAWFWGHEHRCLVYGPQRGLPFSSCVGHGGIPEYLIATGDDPYPAPLTYEYRRKEGDSPAPWNTFGFVALDLDGPALALSYIDEHGVTHHQQAV